MLGVIHHTVLAGWPPQFRDFFCLDERARGAGSGKHLLHLLVLALHESDFALPGSQPAAYIERSAFGLIHVYNKLLARIVETSASFAALQSALQE